MSEASDSKIPEALRNLRQWVFWRAEDRGGPKPTKIPFSARNASQKAATDNPETWASFAGASRACEGEYGDGVGFVFSVADPFVGIDLDDCVDSESGSIAPWAEQMIATFASYTEFSPSRKGVHIFVQGTLGAMSGKKSTGPAERVEVYDRLRYFCVTGAHLAGSPLTIEPRQPELDALLKTRFAPPAVIRPAPTIPLARPPGVTDRARKYMAKMRIAVSGQDGHGRCFHVACVLVIGFLLEPHEAWALMQEYSQHCQPPWSEREINHKLESALTKRDPARNGWLLEERKKDAPLPQWLLEIVAGPEPTSEDYPPDWDDSDEWFSEPSADDLAELDKLKNDCSPVETPETVETIQDTAKEAESPEEALEAHLIAIQEGRWESIPWPWPLLDQMTLALLPETQTILCGGEGGTKSLLMRQAITYWIERGVEVADFELEDNKIMHLNRSLAQIAGERGFVMPEWVKAQGPAALAIKRLHNPILREIGLRMTAAPPQQVTMDQLLEWVLRKCKNRARILVIDPITAIAQGRDSFREDTAFAMGARPILRKYGASIILVTHPRGGINRAAPTLDDMAGGRAWPRFSQNVFWMMSQEEKEEQCASNHGTKSLPVNRMLRIMKARNSYGAGKDLGLYFEKQSLTFSEQGIICKEKKKK